MFFKSMGAQDVSSYFLATESGRGLPKLPTGGILGAQELRALNNVKVVPVHVESAVTPDLIPTREVAYGGICIESLFNERRSFALINADNLGRPSALTVVPNETIGAASISR